MKKQFRYAFWEILIVIIGISIAFSMNKCADNSKSEKERIQYLTNLKSDVEADKVKLAKNVSALNRKIEDAAIVLPYLDSDSINKMVIINKVFNLMNLSNFTPKDATYQTLINSGDLKLIDDFNLKTAIQEHYSGYEEMLKSYLRQESIVRDYGGNYLINHADYDNMQKGKLPFTDEKLLKNIIHGMRGSLMLKKNATERGIKSCDSLLNTLDKAI